MSGALELPLGIWDPKGTKPTVNSYVLITKHDLLKKYTADSALVY